MFILPGQGQTTGRNSVHVAGVKHSSAVTIEKLGPLPGDMVKIR